MNVEPETVREPYDPTSAREEHHVRVTHRLRPSPRDLLTATFTTTEVAVYCPVEEGK